MMVLAAVGLVSLTACSVQQEPTGPQEVLEAHIEAKNAYDMDAALSFVADDAVFDTAFGDYTGKAEITEFLQDEFDRLVQTELSDVEVNGDLVTAKATLEWGTSNPRMESETIVQDGRITSYRLFFPCNPVLEDCD
jgi:ketosteroid isomerase-like protein